MACVVCSCGRTTKPSKPARQVSNKQRVWVQGTETYLLVQALRVQDDPFPPGNYTAAVALLDTLAHGSHTTTRTAGSWF